jgi:hypothetical protein
MYTLQTLGPQGDLNLKSGTVICFKNKNSIFLGGWGGGGNAKMLNELQSLRGTHLGVLEVILDQN